MPAAPPADSWTGLSAVHGGVPWQSSVAAEAGEAAIQTGLFNLLPWDGAEVESQKSTRPTAHVPALPTESQVRWQLTDGFSEIAYRDGSSQSLHPHIRWLSTS